MQINEYILKITGSVNLPEPLNQGQRYLINTEVDIYEETKRDRQDGTIDMIYKGKQTGRADVLTEGKKIIRAESKGTRSKKLHGSIWFYHNTTGSTQPFDQFYEEVMKKLTAYIPEIIDFLNSKN